MLKSWHSWLAQYKYGHPSAVALFEFICGIAVMRFLWQPSDSLNWLKTMAPLSVAAAWGPVLWKNPNMPWPCESTQARASPSACGSLTALEGEHARAPCAGAGLSPPCLRGCSEARPRPPSLKHKQFLSTVTRGRGSTFILGLHLAGCVYALFLKTGLGTLVAQDKVQFVWCKEGCGGRRPRGRHRGSSLGSFFLLIFAVCCNLVPPKGNNLLYSRHFISSKEKLLLCWGNGEEEP